MEQVYTVNRNSLEFYRASYPFLEGHLSFLPTWADVDLFHPSENRADVRARMAAEHGLPHSAAWVLFVGRLQEQKAPLRMIASFAALKRMRDDARLIIVGEGRLMENVVEEARRLGVLDAVCFAGSRPHHALADFYRGCDALLLT